MTDKSINELTNFLKNFSNTPNQPVQNNLSFDNAKEYFFNNMNDRGLADTTKSFYEDKLKAFAKYLAQIKKKDALETLTESEMCPASPIIIFLSP
jgi:hypothetical protein